MGVSQRAQIRMSDDEVASFLRLASMPVTGSTAQYLTAPYR